ncbi:MAG: hypothetical protein BGO21_30310 [Dyadobacter sp. 50-39]|uniref:hypothetical protein n=1 Tax=Dyadobacter sp. 50-39 TaxID=1895756 RepID=UPI00095D9334|nr:hypothetical protein [Dyadobacter sp. 50-39]OJV22452.1 MAG: hypothetical protein BGO21_30310 [Dyadobacter sp. 50-39]
MKQINLILQSKGGVGKSLFIWFVAQIEKDRKTNFIDLDESTQTSAARLGTVVGNDRVRPVRILNEYNKMERDQIVGLLESLAHGKSDQYFIDFGAPESAEFLRLLTGDITGAELYHAMLELGAELRFFVIVAGRDALPSCVNYYNDISKALDSIPVTMVVNMGTFNGTESAEKAIASLTQLGYAPIKRFGDLGSGAAVKEIIDLISQPNPDPATMGLLARMVYKKKQVEIEEIIA